MTTCDPLNPVSLCTLPLESRQAILRHVPDIHTLRAAILSHPSIYSAFLNDAHTILRRILRNLIPPRLLEDAFFAFIASTIETGSWTRERVMAILDQKRSGELSTSVNLTLAEALHMQELYLTVRSFTCDYIFTTLPPASSRPPSPTEWNRVAINFYRFEVYRHLFRQRDRASSKLQKPSLDFTFEEQWDILYYEFPVWEFEQFFCVGEYLFCKVAKAYNDVAAHDVEWAFRGKPFGISEPWQKFPGTPTSIEVAMEDGLLFIDKIVKADTFEERRRLLTPKSRSVATFLPVVLRMIYGGYTEEDLPLKDYNEEDQGLLRGSGPLDADPGPEEAFRHANKDLGWTEFVGSESHWDVRTWGYVMWDHSRLVDTGFLDAARVLPEPRGWDDYPKEQEARTENMVKRWRLYYEGARGWWAEGDESRLTWEDPWELSDEEHSEQVFRCSIIQPG